MIHLNVIKCPYLDEVTNHPVGILVVADLGMTGVSFYTYAHHMEVSVSSWGYPQSSSILDGDFPWQSIFGVPTMTMETLIWHGTSFFFSEINPLGNGFLFKMVNTIRSLPSEFAEWWLKPPTWIWWLGNDGLRSPCVKRVWKRTPFRLLRKATHLGLRDPFGWLE